MGYGCANPWGPQVWDAAVFMRQHHRLGLFLPLDKMATARSKKIVKEKGAAPDEFEESVAQVGSLLASAGGASSWVT